MPQKVKEMRLRAEETDKTIHAYMNVSIRPFFETNFVYTPTY